MRLIAALILVACACSKGFGENTPIALDTATFPSPNGKGVVSFENKDDGWYYLNFKDSKTGQLVSSVKVDLIPVFSLQWTRDSETVVTVGHVAHGSTATLFHFNNRTWSSHIVFPPDLEDSSSYRTFCDISKVIVAHHDIKLNYKITVQTKSSSDEIQEKSYLVTLSINPATNKIIESKRTSAD